MENTIIKPLVNEEVDWKEVENIITKYENENEWDAIKTMVKTNILAVELYEDLKEKYIQLKKERNRLTNNILKIVNKYHLLKNDPKLIKFGRNQFNFGVKIASLVTQEFCVEKNVDLELATELIKRIREIKKKSPNLKEENNGIATEQ